MILVQHCGYLSLFTNLRVTLKIELQNNIFLKKFHFRSVKLIDQSLEIIFVVRFPIYVANNNQNLKTSSKLNGCLE